MHPAFSVILFTTASGAGYGLMALLGALLWRGDLAAETTLQLSTLLIGLVLVTTGLLSSTFHLGHPERAWRAFSQWRSSWLSREGVLAVATYIPAGLLGLTLLFPEMVPLNVKWLGLALAALSLCTVFATAMIYRSLAPVRAWSNQWTVPCYLVLAVMTGAILLNAIVVSAGLIIEDIHLVTWILCLVGYSLKKCYWRFVDLDSNPSTPATATGLNHMGEVRVFEAPHSSDNYLLKEMGFSVGRKHADKLRKIALICGFLLPFGASLLSPVLLSFGVVLALAGVLSATIGILAERWLFFAEARHVVTLYYGR